MYRQNLPYPASASKQEEEVRKKDGWSHYILGRRHQYGQFYRLTTIWAAHFKNIKSHKHHQWTGAFQNTCKMVIIFWLTLPVKSMKSAMTGLKFLKRGPFGIWTLSPMRWSSDGTLSYNEKGWSVSELVESPGKTEPGVFFGSQMRQSRWGISSKKVILTKMALF